MGNPNSKTVDISRQEPLPSASNLFKDSSPWNGKLVSHSSHEILRQKSTDVFAHTFSDDWTIDRYRSRRQYLIYGWVRHMEHNYNCRVPDEIVMIVFIFYYIGHRERFDQTKDKEADAQIVEKTASNDDDVLAFGTTHIDPALSVSKHIWVFRILDKNCCSLTIGITDKEKRTASKFSLKSDGNAQLYPDLKYTWNHMVVMEFDLTATRRDARLRFGVVKEEQYEDAASVELTTVSGRVSRTAGYRMFVRMSGHEGKMQLIEYFEDDTDIIAQQKISSDELQD